MKVLTREQAPGFTYLERERLATLWRRIQFLEDRAANHRGNPSRDLAEAGAMRWLLAEAKMPTPPRRQGA